MVSKRAFGLGPLETIVNVGWGLPVYVSVYCAANRLGAVTPHVAAVTLSDAAIKKGCEIVLNTGATLGSPYNGYFKLVVIKVPGLVSEALFTLALSGTAQQIDFDPPDFFCGNYETFDTVTFVEETFPGIFLYHHVVSYTTPAGTSTLYEYDTTYVPGPPYFGANGHELPVSGVLQSDDFLSYYIDGDLHNTGLPCEDDPPTGKVEQFPFSVQITVNPQKNHTVHDPGGPTFTFDPGEAVKTAGSGNYGGYKTAIWRSFLDYQISQTEQFGVVTSSINFKIQKDIFALQRKEKIIEVYPSTPLAGSEPLTYTGEFRLNKGTPSPFLYGNNWAGTPPDFNDGIVLVAGVPPPPVSWTPYNIPF